MNIEHEYPVTIFKNEYQGKVFYKIGLSKKDKNNNYVNGYMLVQFKNGIELENKTKIYIKKSWLSFYLNKDGNTVPYIFISEFETLQETQQKAKEDPYAIMGEQVNSDWQNIDDSDLPF